ncbi:hypothetical protein SXM_1721 [Shewanella xiamenensis]|nr:hypothetical protein SXM_1721 [Shewanella xiamenensis]
MPCFAHTGCAVAIWLKIEGSSAWRVGEDNKGSAMAMARIRGLKGTARRIFNPEFIFIMTMQCAEN